MNRSFLLLPTALLFAIYAAAESLRGITLDQNRCPQAGNDDDNAVWAKWNQGSLSIIGLTLQDDGRLMELSQRRGKFCFPAFNNTQSSVRKEDGTYIRLKGIVYQSHDPKTKTCNYLITCHNDQIHWISLTPTRDQNLVQPLLPTNPTTANSLSSIALDQNKCRQAENDDEMWAKWYLGSLSIIALIHQDDERLMELSQRGGKFCIPAFDNTQPSVHKENGTYIPLKEFIFISYNPDTYACTFKGRCYNGEHHLFTLSPTRHQNLVQNDPDNLPVITR